MEHQQIHVPQEASPGQRVMLIITIGIVALQLLEQVRVVQKPRQPMEHVVLRQIHVLPEYLQIPPMKLLEVQQFQLGTVMALVVAQVLSATQIIQKMECAHMMKMVKHIFSLVMVEHLII